MGRHEVFAAALVAAAVTACSPAQRPVPTPATEPEDATPAPLKTEPGRQAEAIDWSSFDSTSLRNPNDGSLRGGVPLPLGAPGSRFNPGRDPRARYGTVEVVRALVRAGARVDQELGGLPVTINDLSYERGGPITHHRSHQSGRDVDVLFYQLGPDAEPIESVGAFFGPDGIGVDFRDLADPSDDIALQLDLARTWLFLRALIEDEEAQLQQIFVAEHLRALLLEYARSNDAPSTTVTRFAAMSCQPSYPHDDHFHFRFFCAPEDIVDGCRDSAPLYPWHQKRLERAAVKSRPLASKRPGANAKIVTHEEARAAAGPMDPEVVRWLDRRKQWTEQPHPGRRYCP
ncbi:MAG: penicillin-insensitive murein endopeptidase [Polyangiales bacterium]